MSDLAVSLLKQLREGRGFPPAARLLVAVSGGADSMALLHLYTRAHVYLDIEVSFAAATFDHGLRGEAGTDDALFVAETCAAWGVPCVVGRGDLNPTAPSVEARAREARYRFLADAARDFGAKYVATAHHADDQAETVLLNLIRGTGTRGLGGMRSISTLPYTPRLTLVRPLLAARRADLVAYCKAEGITWRDDPTNTDTKYRRNWVRHTVIPLLAEANPNIVEAVARTAAIIVEQDRHLMIEANAFVFGSVVTDGRVWMKREMLRRNHHALLKRIIVEAVDQIEPDAVLAYAPLQTVDEMVSGFQNGVVELGSGIEVVMDSEYITVARRDAPWTPPHKGPWVGDWTVGATAPAENTLTIRAPSGAAISVRARRDGDRVYPPSLKGKSQKLKEWLINRKVPRQIRDHLPLIVAENKIVALWDGKEWQRFAPPFEGETIEIGLTLRRARS